MGEDKSIPAGARIDKLSKVLKLSSKFLSCASSHDFVAFQRSGIPHNLEEEAAAVRTATIGLATAGHKLAIAKAKSAPLEKFKAHRQATAQQAMVLLEQAKKLLDDVNVIARPVASVAPELFTSLQQAIDEVSPLSVVVQEVEEEYY